MRVAIIGAGSMGTIMGGLISKGGVDITLVDANTEHIKMLNEKGAHISGLMEEIIPVKAVTPDGMEGIYDLIIIMVKQLYNKVALTSALPHMDEKTIVLTPQNGIPEDNVAAIVGKERTIGATVGFAATWKEPGVSLLTSKKENMKIELGEMDGSITPRIREVEKIMSHTAKIVVTDNLMGIRWSKLILNAAVTGIATVLDATWGDVYDSDEALACVSHMHRECQRIMKAQCIRGEVVMNLDPYENNFSTQQEMEAYYPIYRKIIEPYKSVTPSPLQDMRKGIPCEISFINGKVCEEGKKMGIPTPVNQTVVDIVKRIEKGELTNAWQNLNLFKLPEFG